jgi:hypothetical protein
MSPGLPANAKRKPRPNQLTQSADAAS